MTMLRFLRVSSKNNFCITSRRWKSSRNGREVEEPSKFRLPIGYEKFFVSRFEKMESHVSDQKEKISRALKLIPKEQELYLEREKKRSRKDLLRLFWLSLFALSSYKFGHKIWGYTLGNLENHESYSYVVVNLQNHLAVYFNKDGQELSSRQFIDYHGLEKDCDPEKDIIVDVSTYFPWLPMVVLCLLPFFSPRKSNIAINLVQTNEKLRFKFKRDIAVKTRFRDVAGLTEAKNELLEVIDFLKNPDRYNKLGAKLPKGVLLDGPPGVGKTLLAKAVAGEAKVPFVSCSGSEFDEVYVGVGARRVRELFREAHKHKPCVVFIDEIDSFGRKRKSDGRGSSRGTLNAFLSELDGFKDSSGIIVLGATNRADILDDAMTRSGRFDRKITLDKPAFKDRVAISKVHLRPLHVDASSSIEEYAECVAALTAGCSGAEIYNVCNEAAVFAAREKKTIISMSDFHRAADRVLIGLQKSAVTYQLHEKERLAIHEAGEVVVSWFLRLTDPIIKTTVLPRGAHRTGVTQVLPQNIYISTEERLKENIIGKLGGCVAEDYFFKDTSARSAEKLEQATAMARQMICTYGMDPENVGHMGFQLSSSSVQKPFGPQKEKRIDASVESLMSECMQRARQALQKRIREVRIVAALLQRQESLSAQELWLLLGDRPEMTKEFQIYLVT